MKTIVMVAALAAALPQIAYAQGISVGVKAGLNMATISGEAVENTDLKTGLTAGVYLTLSTPLLSLQPEVLVSEKGAKQTQEVGGSSVETRFNSTYVDVPVLVRFGIPLPASPVKPYLFAGPSAGFLLSSKFSQDGEEIDVKDDQKSMDWAAVVGAGVNFGALSIDARANFGLSSVSDSSSDFDMKNRTYSVMVGYRLFGR